jgi:hypothetical protein
MSGLFCPQCGVATTFSPAVIQTERGVLLDDSTSERTVRGRVAVEAVFEPGSRSPHCAIVECPSCHAFFLATKDHGFYGEWQTTWPVRIRHTSQDVPDPVRSALEEALLCLAVRALGGCLMMCRTTLVRLQRDKKAANLAQLRDAGLISTMLHDQANEVRLWANVVGHEDFDPAAVTTDLCEELVAYVESLVDAVYVRPARLAKHRQKRAEAKSRGTQ